MRFLPLLIICLFAFGCSSKGKKAGDSTSTEPAKAEAAKTESAKTGTTRAVDQPLEVVCKIGSTERKLAIVGSNAGCDVIYTKAEGTKTLGSGNGFSGYCDRLVGKVQANLEGAGYKCE